MPYLYISHRPKVGEREALLRGRGQEEVAQRCVGGGGEPLQLLEGGQLGAVLPGSQVREPGRESTGSDAGALAGPGEQPFGNGDADCQRWDRIVVTGRR
jgi:hypothetical protein